MNIYYSYSCSRPWLTFYEHVFACMLREAYFKFDFLEKHDLATVETHVSSTELDEIFSTARRSV